MKKIILIVVLFSFNQIIFYAKSPNNHFLNTTISNTEYETTVSFPADYVIGDYIEFLNSIPISAGSSGYYQISISYDRGNIAAAATHLVAISHANSALWREVGRINNNPYLGTGMNFTVDCNTEYSNSRFRIRAINTLGTQTNGVTIYVKVTSLNINGSFTALSNKGNDLTVSKFVAMTSDWDLYVGNNSNTNGASLAIKAIQNGNVGIGTEIPDEKLTVKGKIHTQEVRVDMAGPLVPDYVFANDYKLKSLKKVEDFIKENKHLPEIPSAQEIEKNGLLLAEMNMNLLKKMEEMTLYMIEMKKENEEIKKENEKQDEKILLLESKLSTK